MPKPLLITPGDPSGIGPEIVTKTLLRAPPRSATFVVVGARQPFDGLGVQVREISPSEIGRVVPRAKEILILPAPTRAPEGTLLEGFQSGWSISAATRLVLQNKASAIVTGPISKERLQRGGFDFPGHTELLAHLCGIAEPTMMLANSQLRVSLVTIHQSLASVSRSITEAKIRRAVLHTAESLRAWWKIRRPRIAVAALNPHAGEGGIFGKEEIRVIQPALANLKKSLRGKAIIEGPLPADTLFAKHLAAKPSDRYDAVVCMYHDQGLIPVKLLDFPRTVNVTLGLPILRTSVDHGVGFDIAGKNLADPSSFRAALELAIRLRR